MVKKFDKKYLTKELELPWWDENVVLDEIIDKDRWDDCHRLVFKDLDGTLWETTYWVGATEIQPEGPWEYEDMIECKQVKLAPVIIEDYLPIEEVAADLPVEELVKYFNSPAGKEKFENFLKEVLNKDV